MEHNNGVSNINGHVLPPLSPPSFQAATTRPFLSPNQMKQQMHHQVEEEEEEEKRKKMKLKSSANWLGLADNTYHHISTKDIAPSFPNTTTMDHPFLQLHPYHHHHQQQQLPEMAIAKSSIAWQLGSNIRGEENQSRINLTQVGKESLINSISTVDGGVHKWYSYSPDEEWEKRVGLTSNSHMVDPTGFLSSNNIQQSFMNYTDGNSRNSNNNTAVMKGGGSSSRSNNNKDRHSKVFTAKGVRDRRIRLAVSTATQFYDIQDRLGYEQPSKAVDWLMNKARASIDQLPRMEPYSTLLSTHSTASIDLPISTATIQPNSDAFHPYGSSTTHQIQDISGKPHAEDDDDEEEEEQDIKVVSGVEMTLADETSPTLSLPCIRTTIDIAASSSSYYSSLPSTGLQLKQNSLKLCRSDRR